MTNKYEKEINKLIIKQLVTATAKGKCLNTKQ